MKRYLLASLLLFSFGCAPKEDASDEAAAPPPQESLEPSVAKPESVDKNDVAGNWSGKYEASEPSDGASSKEAAQMSGMLATYRASLELRADGTYTFFPLAGAAPVDDEWTIDGNTIVLASSGMDESSAVAKPNKQEYVLEVNEDGTLTGPDPIKMGYGAMVYQKF